MTLHGLASHRPSGRKGVAAPNRDPDDIPFELTPAWLDEQLHRPKPVLVPVPEPECHMAFTLTIGVALSGAGHRVRRGYGAKGVSPFTGSEHSEIHRNWCEQFYSGPGERKKIAEAFHAEFMEGEETATTLRAKRLGK